MTTMLGSYLLLVYEVQSREAAVAVQLALVDKRTAARLMEQDG